MLFLASDGVGIFQWLVDAFDRMFTRASYLFSTFDNIIDGIRLIESVVYSSPSFIIHIFAATMGVAVLMWVVNLF